MKTRCALFLLLAAPLLSPALRAQDTPAPDAEVADAAADFEVSPVLQASEILRPEYLQGAYHRVRETVPTYSGANRYTIDSDFGTFPAEGNVLLMQRVAEIGAIRKLRDISETEEYKRAFIKAAKSPVELARHLAKDPVGTVSSVPKGLWKFVNRAGQGIKEATNRRERSPYEEGVGRDLVGVSKAKRELAAKLGVNPYSTNEALQTELNRVAWTSVAGGATIQAFTLALSGGAAIAATSINVADTTTNVLRDTAPLDLRLANEKRLKAIGISDEATTAFLANPAFSPFHQTYFVTALEQLGGVEGRTTLLEAAANHAEEELDAIFFTRTAQLLAALHKGDTPLARISTLNGLPVAIAKDRRIVVALEWDYAVWTEATARFCDALRDFATSAKPNPNTRDLPVYLLALTGDVSPRLAAELTGRNVQVRTRIGPNPLR